MKLFNEEQRQQLKEISANLRRVREEKSLQLEEIAAKTHIRPFMLQALEAGKFEELPEPVFVKGFIRRYAEALGLNGINLADSWQINYLPIDYSPKNNNSPKSQPSFYLPLAAPYILLLVAASVGIFYLLNFQVKDKILAQKSNSLSIEQKTQPSLSASIPAPSPISTINLTPAPTPKNTPTDNKLIVNLELQGPSWLHIKADGQTKFEGTLPKGKRKTLIAKKSVTVRSGNAGVVLISVNDQQPKPLGKAGEVKEATFANN